MSSVDVFDAGDGDLGLVNANDEHSVFLMSPERHLRRLPELTLKLKTMVNQMGKATGTWKWVKIKI